MLVSERRAFVTLKLINDGAVENNTITRFEAGVIMGGCAEGQDKRTREYILNVAECMISSRGPESVTMGSVASKAGISRGVLYHYFSTRESLYAAVAARIVEALNSAISGYVCGLRGIRKIRASSRAIALYQRSNPDKMAVLEKLRSVKVRDPGDENARELIRLVGENQHMLAEAVGEIGVPGTFVAGIDPLAAGQFLRMALHDASGLPPIHMALLDMHGTRGGEDFLKNARDPLYRSILISPDN